MTIPAAADWAWVARWMVLLSTLFGLATMHTLGHTAVRMEPHRHATAVLGTAAPMAQADAPAAASAPAVHAAVPADCPHDGCGGHRHGDMTGWGICLAVLTGLAVAVLLAAFLLRRTGHRAHGNPLDWGSGRPRPPPPRPAGFLLASTAVLRI